MKRQILFGVVGLAVCLVIVACVGGEPTPPPSPLAGVVQDVPGQMPEVSLQDVLDFLVANQEVIALAAAFLISLVSRGLKGLEATGSQLMLSIEKLAKDQVLADGVDKMSEVVAGVLDKIPPTLKPLLATYAIMRGKTVEQLVRELCQKWYDKAVGFE